jgi:ubiquinone/menaquinone biosynthesis C-methylase UbiE
VKIEKYIRRALGAASKIFGGNGYTQIQKWVYRNGTSDHLEHNANPDYWQHLLGPVKNDPTAWKGKAALDFGCGRGRNVANLLAIAEWSKVDGIDLSKRNIQSCRKRFDSQRSSFFLANGTNLDPLENEDYDFVMSTITLQHIPVYSIRDEILNDLFRVLTGGGTLSLQMGFGERPPSGSKSERAEYGDDVFSALGSNSDYDVEITSVEQIKSHLSQIGFIDLRVQVTASWSDINHSKWIWVTAKKP